MKNRLISVIAAIGFIVTCRVVPHLANCSPMICVALFATAIFSKRIAVVVVVLGMLLSDVLLAQQLHYPIIGSWSLFTYSALLGILALGARVNLTQQRMTLGVLTVLASNLGFWVWTNFGSWLASYAHTVTGLVTCYTVALPFLQHSTLSALLWYGVFMAVARTAQTPLVSRLFRHDQV